MQNAKQAVLGIEGGGTKTDWALFSLENEELTLIKEGRLSSANLKLISDTALLQLFRALPGNVDYVGVFLAGCSSTSDQNRLEKLVRTVWPNTSVTVGSDRQSGVATALQEEDGICVIAGTGAAVTGRKGDQWEKAGGWGQLLGDKGSSYNLSVQGLRLTLSNYDLDQVVTPLGQDILHTLCLNRLEDLVNWAKDADKMSVANLVPVIFKAAREGDREMIAAIETGAYTLACFTKAVAKRLDLKTPKIRLFGGLFVHQPDYVDLYSDYTTEFLPKCHIDVCKTSGAFGAAWLAIRKPIKAPVLPSKPDMLAELSTAVTEQSNARSESFSQLTVPKMVDLFISEEKQVKDALRSCKEEIGKGVELIAESLKKNGRLFYVGAGTSGRLGVLDASEIPPTFGTSPEIVQGIIAGGVTALHRAVEGAEDQAEQGYLTLSEREVKENDIVCGITASGRTPFVLGALNYAREHGARTILLTCNPSRHKSIPKWDVEIDLPTGPEIVTGSTRLKAGTATKLVLNIFTTCSMVLLGKVLGNRMTHLQTTNIKLRHRAIRLVSELRKCSAEEAEKLLARNHWDVETTLRK